MIYEVTATRRRPRTFDELVGQEFVVATIKNSLSSGRIAHAYLFSGPRGVGKTSAARILAKALNCPEGPTAEGCEEWSGSEEIARGNALDVIEIDGASNTSVNDVRQIKDEVLFAPNSSRYKIYIIDEVHMLSTSAFNALLKTIEEPPPYIVFVFATTEIHKVPATIRSRCQQFIFRLIPMEEIKSMLAAACEDLGVDADDDALGWIAKEAGGSLRDAYTLLDQVVAFSDGRLQLSVIQSKLGLVGLERLNNLMEAIVAQRAGDALTIAHEAMQSGVAPERFVTDLADYLRTLLLISAGIKREAVLGMPSDRMPEAVRTAWDRPRIELANELALQLYRDIRYSVNQRFELELAISRLASLSSVRTPHALVQEVQALQEALVHEAAYRARTPGAEEPEPAQQDQKAQEIDAAAPPEVSGITVEQVESIISRFRTQRISVAALLSRARQWYLDGNDLAIIFADEFGANALTADVEPVQGAAKAVLGLDRLSVRILTEDAPDGRASAGDGREADPAVDMVKRVFRGEIVEDKS